MTKGNICVNCKHATPQDNSGLGLVNCHVVGHGNACQTKCDHFRENSRLASLKEAAITAIKEFERMYAIPIDGNELHAASIERAATYAVALQDAYAMVLDISKDMAAEILHEEARVSVVVEATRGI